MSQQIVINSLEFARDGEILEGFLSISDLPRLHDLLASVEGQVKYRLAGSLGPNREPQLELQAEGALMLRCQRCLEGVAHVLDVDGLLELVDEEAELSSEALQENLEDDFRDFIPAQKDLDVVSLIEEEILLSLPVVPRHDNCVLPDSGKAAAKDSPFAVLAGLKGKK